jgi:DNA invertase Pin-like site-specific DNA recombinase
MARSSAAATAAKPRFTPARRRAVGIIRVSEVDGRSGEAFRSPGDQLGILERHCASRSYSLVASFQELDVSGYTIQELHKRKLGLAPAVAMIEAGEADVILLPWLDRIARNLQLYRAVVKKVRAAGGTIEAVDFGEVTGGSAAQRFSAETLIRVAEFFAELTAEKTNAAQEKAIAEGIPTFANIPIGYRSDDSRRLEVVEEEAALVRTAYEMREIGTPLEDIRDWLHAQPAAQAWMAAHKRKLGIRGVQNLLKQRMYLGELHFGKMSNLRSHEPIIDPALFRTVQGMRIKRDTKREPSDRLLARLGIVRCATCDKAMVVGGQWHENAAGERVHYPDYRCSSMQTCTRRAYVSAEVLEEAVVRFVRTAHGEGNASADEELAQAERAFQEAEQQLSTFITLLAGVGDLAATQAKLEEMKAARETAFEHWQSLRVLSGTSNIRASAWDDLSLSGRRALIRATVKRVVITRGARGTHQASRITIEPFAQ